VYLGDQVEHLHGIQLDVRRIASGQFDDSDADRPDVSFGVVGQSFDDLGCDPKCCVGNFVFSQQHLSSEIFGRSPFEVVCVWQVPAR
jgi:hypothetical protein